MLDNYTYHLLYQLGGRYIGGETHAAREAGEILAAAADDIERAQVRSEFHEGVRNRAAYQDEVDRAMRTLELFANAAVSVGA